jgi:hypothetical protein
VTLVAQDAEKLRELDIEVRRAWAQYTDSVRELRGEEYERAEDASWQALQLELARLDRSRRNLSITIG